MVSGTAPNTLFGVIPAGRTDISQPLNRISRVQVSTKLGAGPILLSAILVLMAVGAESPFLWVLALIPIAAAYRAELVITDSGGGTQEVGVSPLDREQVQNFAAAVNEQVAQV